MITDLFGNPITPIIPPPPTSCPPGKVSIQVYKEVVCCLAIDNDIVHNCFEIDVDSNTLNLNCAEEQDGNPPAYISMREHLIFIFGLDEAERIIMHFEDGGGDMVAFMSINKYNKLCK